MKPVLIILAAMVVVGLPLWLHNRWHRRHADGPREERDAVAPTGCAADCALQSVCPSQQLLTARCQAKIDYYDDEELDRFSGRTASQYSPDEVDQWREVLMTLQPREVLPWGQSIRARGLVMPTALRDEFLARCRETQHPPANV